VKAALKLTVTAKLHKDSLIEREANEIQRLRDGGTAGIVIVGHGGIERLNWVKCRSTTHAESTSFG
jgi:hypothetical protein